MLKRYLKILIGYVYLIGFFLNAQELPPVERYSTKQYKAENQNWAIAQSSDSYIFIANNKGLLEFNGEYWKTYTSPNETIIRTVFVVDDLVYTGSYMDFGYWKRDKYGVLNYTSLSSQLDIPRIEDEQFWNITDLDDWILFQSLDRIIIYNTKDLSFKIINSKTTLTKLFKANESIYFQSINQGIYKIENGKAKLVIDHQLVKDNIVVNIYDYDGQLLILTQNKGFYLGSEYEDDLTLWDISANSILAHTSVYNSIQLKDKGFALGTISNGFIYLKSNGDLNYQMNQSTGLSNNTVLALFEDKNQNIWLALDNGINCVNTDSPFHIYNDQKGTIGTVYSSAIHGNTLYLGTNQGLFYKALNSNDDFTFIKGTQGQVWALVEQYGTLFCAHNLGTFIIDEDEAQFITGTDGTWDIKVIDSNPNLLLQGTYEGLSVIERIDGSWEFKNKIEGFNISSRYVESINENEFFVSHEYKGVFKIKVDQSLTKVLDYTNDNSIDKGPNSSLIQYDGELLYTIEEGVYKYDTSQKSFKRDSIYSQLFKDQTYTSGKLVETSQTNKLWSFSNEGLNYMSSGKLTDKPEIVSIPFPISIRNSMGGYENISYIEDETYLFGSSSGYILVDLDKIKNKAYQIRINEVSNNAIDNNKKPIDKTVYGEFQNAQNNIQFSFSVFEYEKFAEAEYQYQLKGIYDEWSDWSQNSTELFKNLPFGDYVFNVRAKIGDKLSANVASYEFTIDKPWYLTNTMLVLYVLSVIAFSLLMHNIYKRYYKKQRERLLVDTQRELELRKLENEQQLMSFKNEKLQQDIDSKNRELAISTMSLIKKNEFLNSIKEKLNEAKNENNIDGVISIIDKDLNNTNDWKLFQEAFNNADKNFLKKIKSLHPALTPNDLRLCAYLRLNLSSKEIAPLLNISHRSVEVKRYRLRKKMNLPHEASLTDYILEI